MKYQNANIFRITSICLTILFLGSISAYVAHAQTENYSLNTSWQFAAQPSQYSVNLTSIAADASGNVYLADYSKHFIEKFATNGTLITEWAFENNTMIKYNQAGIAVDPSGNVYVVEGWDPIIEKFTPNNNNSYSLNTTWQFAPFSQNSANQTSIAVDSLGNVYLADYNKNLIEKFTTNGTPITEWTFGNNTILKSGQIGIAVGPSGNVYVIKGYDPVIEKFIPNDPNSYSLAATWQFAPSQPSNNFTSIAVDTFGNVYLADYSKHFIEKFTTNGTLITEWAFENNTQIKVAQAGIAVDSPGNVYVVKSWDPIIEKFSPLVANFTSNVTNGTAPLSVQFNDTSIGSPTNWTWKFGDGNTSTEQNPLPHMYYNNGTYIVTLNVSNAYGSNSTSAVINVSSPLVANFTTNITADGINIGRAPLSIQFNDTSTGSPTNWTWEFGDGNTSIEQNPFYTYHQPGNYTVNLTVSNAHDSNSTNQTILVMFQPYPNGYSFKNHNTSKHSPEDFHNTYNRTVDTNRISWETTFYLNWFIDESDKGNCFGMASTSLLLYNRGVNNLYVHTGFDPLEEDWKGYIIPYYDRLPLNIVDGIISYQPLQEDEACLKDKGIYKGIETVYKILHQNLENGKIDMVLNIHGTFNGSNGDHSIVPYKIEESTDKVSAKIYVYDCNSPGKDRHLDINLKTGKISDYVSNDDITITGIHDIDLISLEAINKTPQIPSWIEIQFYKHLAHLFYTDSSGRHLGDYQGVLKNEIPGTCPLRTCGGDNVSNSIEAYYVPDPSIKMELCGTGTGDSETSMMTPSSLITAYVPVSPTSVDEFKVLNNGTGIYFNSENGTVPSLRLMLDVESTDHAQIVNASISQIEVGGSVSLSNDNGNITIQNNGLSRTCNMSIEQATSSQNSSVTINNIAIEAGSTLYIKPSDWNYLSGSTVTIEHDVGNDGTIDYTQTIGQQDLPIMPISNFTANVTEGYAPLDVQFTNTSTNETHLEWNFGDLSGNVSTPNPEHVFTSTGLFNVVLTASNVNGSSSKNVTINVTSTPVQPTNPTLPTAIIGANTTSGTAPLTVQFNDLSLNETLGRTWTFGDGSPSTIEANPIYTYNTAGTFTVNLTASNPGGANVTSMVITVTAPVPPQPSVMKVNDFRADVTSGFEPLKVNFTSDVSGSPTKWTWRFERAATQNYKVGTATHIFMQDGVYDVTLTVKDAKGHTNSMTKKAFITVLKVPAPKASFTANVTSGKAPLTVQFNDTSANNPTNWLWSFGDGQVSIKQNPTHKYGRVGKYTITLLAKNYGGLNTKIVKNYITVNRN